jgi:hypothetical protein
MLRQCGGVEFAGLRRYVSATSDQRVIPKGCRLFG